MAVRLPSDPFAPARRKLPKRDAASPAPVPQVIRKPPPMPSRPPQESRARNTIPEPLVELTRDLIRAQGFAEPRYVADFQEAKGLKIDGVIGPKTMMAALQSSGDASDPPSPSPPETELALITEGRRRSPHIEDRRADAGMMAAAAGGMIEGLPIVGPIIKGSVDRGVAGLRSLVEGTPYADELRTVQHAAAVTERTHPIAATVGNIVGGVLGTAPMVTTAPAAFGAVGSLAERMALSGASGSAIGAADAVVRSGGDLNAAPGGATGGLILGGLSPYVAADVARVLAPLLRNPSNQRAVEAIVRAFLAPAPIYANQLRQDQPERRHR